MRISRVLLIATCLLMLTLSFWSPANSTLVRAGEEATVAEDETVAEDLALFAASACVDGYVESDVIALARTINVPGIINQDLMGGAETVEITGQVGDDMRVGARFLDVRGQVGDDLIAFCQRLTLGEDGRVGGEVRAWCQKATFNGDVDGNLRAGCELAEIQGHVGGNLSVHARRIDLAGAVDGDVELKAESITLLPGCIIAGNLKYTSANQIEMQEGARVLGQTEWQKPEVEVTVPKRKGIEGLGTFITFLKLAMLVAQIAVGLILIGISRKQVALMANTLTGHPWKSLGVGFVFLFCVPIVSLILLFTIIGLPLAILAIFLYLIIWYLSPIVVGLTIGGKMVKAFKENRMGPMVGGLILGLIILRVISFIPAAGVFVQFLVILFGMGAILVSRKTARDEAREKGVI